MLREDRLSEISELIRQNGRVITTELMDRFDMSEGSIRRDLNELQKRGILKKVFGGAISQNQEIKTEPEWSREAESLAAAALESFHKAKKVYVDMSEPNLALVSKAKKNQRIYTNSLEIVQFLDTSEAEVHLLGGEVDFEAQFTKGYELIHRLEELNIDLAVIGVEAFHPVFGLSSDQEEVAMAQHTIIKGPTRTIILIKKDQFPKQSMYSVARPEMIDQIYISQNLSSPYQELLRKGPFSVEFVSL